MIWKNDPKVTHSSVQLFVDPVHLVGPITLQIFSSPIFLLVEPAVIVLGRKRRKEESSVAQHVSAIIIYFSGSDL